MITGTLSPAIGAAFTLAGSVPKFVEVRDDEVHVLHAFLDVAPSRVRSLHATLSADERQRADVFHFTRDRNRFIVARALLRILLGRYVQTEPAWLRFRYGPKGKPFLAGGHDTALRFNLSHSNGLALYAVTRRREIGIDVEYAGRKLDYVAIAERFFSPREVADLGSLPEEGRQRAFFACWTRKEAYIKARGDGFSVALDTFEVSLRPEEPAVLRNVDGNPEETSRWCLAELGSDPRYAAALAVEGTDWRLKYWRSAGLIGST